MKEKTTNKRKPLYYAILAVSALLLTAAIVLTVYFVTGGGNEIADVGPSSPAQPTDPTGPVEPSNPSEPDQPSGGDAFFCNPVSDLTVSNGFGFYQNVTLNWFYDHEGVDVSAAEGTSVAAMAKGTVLSVSTDETTGTSVVLDHGDGLFTAYRYVNPVNGLKVGDVVAKGATIATVAAATGKEYKEGPHLHLEVFVDGVNVDPSAYLTLSEK